jgi:hypothetical protein
MSDASRQNRSLHVLVSLGFSALLAAPLSAQTAAEKREAYLRGLASHTEKEPAAKDKNGRTVGKGRTPEEARANAMKELAAPKTIKLEQAGLQFSTVASWTETKPSGLPGTVAGACYQDPKLDAAGNGRDGLMIVRVLPLADGKTVDDVLGSVTKELNCCGPHYATKPEAELPLAGETARTLVFEPQEARVKDQKWYVAAAQHGAKAYVFMLFTHTGDYAITRPGVDKMLKSVKWLGAPVSPTPLPPAKPQPPATYTFKEQNLSYAAPGNWTVSKQPAAHALHTLETRLPKAANGAEMAWLQVYVDRGRPLETFVKEFTDKRKAMVQFEAVEGAKGLGVAGEPAQLLRGTGLGELKDNRSLLVVTRHGDASYLFVFQTSSPDLLPAMRTQANEILKSVTWLDGAAPAAARAAAPAGAPAGAPKRAGGDGLE